MFWQDRRHLLLYCSSVFVRPLVLLPDGNACDCHFGVRVDGTRHLLPRQQRGALLSDECSAVNFRVFRRQTFAGPRDFTVCIGRPDLHLRGNIPRGRLMPVVHQPLRLTSHREESVLQNFWITIGIIDLASFERIFLVFSDKRRGTCLSCQ